MAYKTLVFATIAIAALSVTVWAHHMYATGQVLLPFFAVMTMLIAVPTGVKFFDWIGPCGRQAVLRDAVLLPGREDARVAAATACGAIPDLDQTVEFFSRELPQDLKGSSAIAL